VRGRPGGTRQAQAAQIVAAAQANKIPVTYAAYPDEGHGWRTRWSTWLPARWRSRLWTESSGCAAHPPPTGTEDRRMAAGRLGPRRRTQTWRSVALIDKGFRITVARQCPRQRGRLRL